MHLIQMTPTRLYGSDRDGDVAATVTCGMWDLEERLGASHGAAFLHFGNAFHIKISKIQCLKWE